MQSTLWYHFLKLWMPSVIASLTSRYRGCSTIDSQRLIRNSSDGIIRHTVGVRSLENVCCTFDGSCGKSCQKWGQLINRLVYAPGEPHGWLQVYPNPSSRAGSQHRFDLLTNSGLSHWHQPGEWNDLCPARLLSVCVSKFDSLNTIPFAASTTYRETCKVMPIAYESRELVQEAWPRLDCTTIWKTFLLGETSESKQGN